MIDPKDTRGKAGLPPSEYQGNHFGMVADPKSTPLPFSDVEPISPEKLMGEEGQEESGFDANAPQAPAHWPDNLAELWPNLPPDMRTSVNNAIAQGDTGSEEEKGPYDAY